MSLETKINESAKSLTSFNGATTVTVGTVDLDVYSLPVINSQTFMVIDEQLKHQDQVTKICLEVSPEEGWKPEEDVELIPLDADQPDRKARIGSRLSPNEKVAPQTCPAST
ncbi:unnamed protein product [Prunus brigantina]